MQVLVRPLFAQMLILSSSCSLWLVNILRSFPSRAQAGELWVKNEKVTCGYISEDTRVRSQGAGEGFSLPFLVGFLVILSCLQICMDNLNWQHCQLKNGNKFRRMND